MRKLTVLAIALASLAAMCAPSMAQGQVWTAYDLITLEEGETVSEPFEGSFSFNGGNFGSYECDVTIEIEAEGPAQGRVTKFSPTTSSCHGSSFFFGCRLEADSSNVGEWEGWPISLGGGYITVSIWPGKITLSNTYDKKCPIPSSHLEFSLLSLSPGLNGEGTITSLSLSGTSTSGIPVTGFFLPEGEHPALGIE
jgi:hypothetical protein